MIGWGAEFADFDGDGWLDLVVANGSTFETSDTPPRLKPQEPFLFAGSIEIDYVVRNAGDAAADSAWTDRIYLSTDDVFDGFFC